MLEFLKAPFLAPSYYTLMTSLMILSVILLDLPDDVICNIALNDDNTILNSEYDQASDLWQQLELVSDHESDLRDTMMEKLNWFCLTGPYYAEGVNPPLKLSPPIFIEPSTILKSLTPK